MKLLKKRYGENLNTIEVYACACKSCATCVCACNGCTLIGAYSSSNLKNAGADSGAAGIYNGWKTANNYKK